MDFAATVDLKNPDSINWKEYPIQRGLFYETGWSLEPREEKKNKSFPIPDATILVIIHQDHRDYYIPNYSDEYTPFVLIPALHRDTRLYIQEYFRKYHYLELSVRPIHAKWISQDGRPYIAVNAQIQAWDREQFRKTDKKSAQSIIQKIIPKK